MTYHFGSTVLEPWPMVPAHTYGDIVAWLPQHKILFVGDIGFFYVRADGVRTRTRANGFEVCNTIDRMGVETIVPGHGPLGGRAELADMRDYLVRLKSEARTCVRREDDRRYRRRRHSLGRYTSNSISPERIVLNVQRFYDEFAGTLTPDVNVSGIQRATGEYNAARNAAR